MISDLDQPRFLPSAHLTQEQFPPGAVCWPALEGEEITAAMEELDDWVLWLTDRYALDHRTIPPCWGVHGALLEELSALRTAWITAYAKVSKGDEPLHWHAHFSAARQRLTEWVARTGCRPGEHRNTP